MCGIVGYVNFDGSEVPLELIKKATDELEHRGPDGEGQWVFGNVGLGHRRLSIIDLSELGSQPMLSLDGNFVISYNGEIYNYLEIKKELEVEGYNFLFRGGTLYSRCL